MQIYMIIEYPQVFILSHIRLSVWLLIRIPSISFSVCLPALCDNFVFLLIQLFPLFFFLLFRQVMCVQPPGTGRVFVTFAVID